jgi:hypothetical protein
MRWNPDADEGSHSLHRSDNAVQELSFERLRRSTLRSPEGRLALAVLEDAVDCFQKYLYATRSRHRRFYRESESWLFADSRGTLPVDAFTSNYICDSLGIDRGAMRWSLMRWRDQQLAARANTHPLSARREAA